MKHRIAAVGFTFLLTGCYPMEQAPLVYASKQTIGLSLTGGTTDNPGLDLIIGYKDTNVALVPVAVAKRCVDNENCENEIYSMDIVEGTKSDLLDSGTLKAELTRIDRELLAKQAALEIATNGVSSARKITLDFTNKTTLESQLAGLGKVPAADSGITESAEIATNRANLNSQISNIKVTEAQNTEALGRIADFERTQRNLETDISGLNKVRASLSTSLSQSQSGERNDAYSVYGTFEGTANGRVSEGSVGGNRIFATGIAAQNLTESLGFTECLLRADKVATHYKDDAKRQAFLDQAVAYCGKKKSNAGN